MGVRGGERGREREREREREVSVFLSMTNLLHKAISFPHRNVPSNCECRGLFQLLIKNKRHERFQG